MFSIVIETTIKGCLIVRGVHLVSDYRSERLKSGYLSASSTLLPQHPACLELVMLAPLFTQEDMVLRLLYLVASQEVVSRTRQGQARRSL